MKDFFYKHIIEVEPDTIFEIRQIREITMFWQQDSNGNIHIRQTYADGYTKFINGAATYSIPPWYNEDEKITGQVIIEEDVYPYNINYWFAHLEPTDTSQPAIVNLDNIHADEMEYAIGAFCESKIAGSIDLSNWNLEKCKYTQYMFALTETSNIILPDVDFEPFNAVEMFVFIENPPTIELGKFSLRKAEDAANCFANCDFDVDLDVAWMFGNVITSLKDAFFETSFRNVDFSRVKIMQTDICNMVAGLFANNEVIYSPNCWDPDLVYSFGEFAYLIGGGDITNITCKVSNIRTFFNRIPPMNFYGKFNMDLSQCRDASFLFVGFDASNCDFSNLKNIGSPECYTNLSNAFVQCKGLNISEEWLDGHWYVSDATQLFGNTIFDFGESLFLPHIHWKNDNVSVDKLCTINYATDLEHIYVNGDFTLPANTSDDVQIFNVHTNYPKLHNMTDDDHAFAKYFIIDDGTNTGVLELRPQDFYYKIDGNTMYWRATSQTGYTKCPDKDGERPWSWLPGIEKVIIEENLKLKSTESLFAFIHDLTSIEGLKKLDLSIVDSAINMFAGLQKMTSLDLTDMDFSHITKMGGMFAACPVLQHIYVNHTWSSSQVTFDFNMFNASPMLPNYDSSQIGVEKAYYHGDGKGYLTFYSDRVYYKITEDGSTVYLSNIAKEGYRKYISAPGTTPWCSNNNRTLVIIEDDLYTEHPDDFFAYMPSLVEIRNLNKLDVSQAKDFSSMFYNDSALKELDLTSFDTHKATDMMFMFANCAVVNPITISSNWNVDNVISSSSMFLGAVNLPNFNPSQVDKTHANADPNTGYLTAV